MSAINYRFIDQNASDTLENRRREQEERKLMLLREQKTKELKQLETQLYYKQQEVLRLKTLLDRLRREQVERQNKEIREKNELLADQRVLKDAESKVGNLEIEIGKALADISEKISKEKQIILEHQRNLEELEKKKREVENKKESNKRMFMSSISRILFMKKKDESDFKNAERLFKNTQMQITQIEKSLKVFNQETTVLQNKIRAIQTTLKGIV